jgi:hypothetical protein
MNFTQYIPTITNKFSCEDKLREITCPIINIESFFIGVLITLSIFFAIWSYKHIKDIGEYFKK